jgi:hypothetical protein
MVELGGYFKAVLSQDFTPVDHDADIPLASLSGIPSRWKGLGDSIVNYRLSSFWWISDG